MEGENMLTPSELGNGQEEEKNKKLKSISTYIHTLYAISEGATLISDIPRHQHLTK
jgi:hypothetical protein